MAKCWVMVQIQDSEESTVLGDGVRRHCMVCPRHGKVSKVCPEVRTVDEVIADAAAKGYDTSYMASFYGVSDQRMQEIFIAVRDYLFAEVGSFPKHAIRIEPVLKVIGRG